MRKFHSYGPVDCEEHFCVQRNELIQSCTEQIMGNPEKTGHYFTIWAPRQTGKTWLMRQMKKEIESCYGNKFLVGSMSVQGIIMEDDDPEDVLFRQLPRVIRETFQIEPEIPKTWDNWIDWFSKAKGLFDKPLILFIDEFDSLPAKVIDRLVTIFRDMYLKPESYIIHGLALIGVRALLGVESDRGSPFNIQKSLHVPNLTKAEVENLYGQYQKESGQKIEADVIEKIYEITRGQPGLVSWFGELLTEKFNSKIDENIGVDIWNDVLRRAKTTEWNNTVLNLIKKAKGKYYNEIIRLFAHSDIVFRMDSKWCSFAYLNGIIDYETIEDSKGIKKEICRFSCPFVQHRIYNALTDDLAGDRLPLLALDPLDDLADVLEQAELNLPALINRYKDYLKRLKVKGLNPWKDQPRRVDLHLSEAVGHFHLYAWFKDALEDYCIVSPEFPTGNGKVDLHIKCNQKSGIIEVKSFKSMSKLKIAELQAAGYAKQLNLKAVTLAVFVPTKDENVIEKLCSDNEIEGIKITIAAIGWE